MASDKKKEVAAICCADLHFSERPPVARSCEENWLRVQEYHWEQVRALQTKHKAPILIAGDIFHKWNSSPLLIGQVINWFHGAKIIAIPGNHDLPEHNYLQLGRSAYWVLVEAGVISHLTPGGTYEIGPMVIHPFPYGFDIKLPEKSKTLSLNVALVHAYAWTKTTGHPGASESGTYGSWLAKLKGYDTAVFGDNHKPWVMHSKKGNCHILNCGGFQRRNSDEKDHKPSVWLMYQDGTFGRVELDCLRDMFIEVDDKPLPAGMSMEMSDFVQELSDMHGEKVDFTRAVLTLLEKQKVSPEVKTLMLRAIGVKQ